MQVQEFFSRLFADYVNVTPRARGVHDLIERQFGSVTNDHVAFRTFATPNLGIAQLERPFLEWGYRRDNFYPFPNKHLRAYGYIPTADDLPLLFISELILDELPQPAASWCRRAAAQAAPASMSVEQLLLGTRPWEVPSFEVYQALTQASPYAAWLSAWGYRANHFTVAVHALPTRPSLRQLVDTLLAAEVPMNTEGGLIQGTKADLLEQASTLAEPRAFEFAGGQSHVIPSCYYEFAERHRQPDGALYRGFVAQNANNIFESTTARKELSRAPTGRG